MVIYAGFVAGLNHYLNSHDLRQRVGQKTAQVLQTRGGYLPFSWRGLSVYSEGFVGIGLPGRSLTGVGAQHIWAHCSPWQLWHRKIEITRVSLEHFQASFGSDAAMMITHELSKMPELEQRIQTGSLVTVDIREVVADRTDVFWGNPKQSGGCLKEVVSRFWPDGKNLVGQGLGGTFSQSGFPIAHVESFALYYAKPELRIDTATLTLGGHSRIDVSGRFEFTTPGTMEFAMKCTACPIDRFIGGKEHLKLKGTFGGGTKFKMPLGGQKQPSAEGSLSCEGGSVEKDPSLEKLAAFTGDRRFDPLRLQVLKGDYRWDSTALTLDHIVAESQGLVRAEGGAVIRKGIISGEFEIGVIPKVVDSFPGAREEVFTRVRDGYCWTSVKLSGPAKKPKNDLKPRLVAAAEKHFARGLLAPLLKPGHETIDKLRELF